ncbi:MAG: Ribose ABC transport system, ATP-binding protein RbsA [uncultured Thermomicrobiales bacterium]|uniref:Ribose ABC transport system, ATP-binding protein RbsA n=1 Tax=uncultured Thermomicrobiales bacterium TaxID=1645740 RepID=A0A6J4UAL7_9BACT|nr:MAG: Ribose ABC transport system, ATP-binding protein RbsA [uncultured Thermomicrobiales bacterium]
MAQDQVAAAARPAADGEPLLRMAGITKLFPGVVALRDVSLEVFPGECLALVGENGAGKSTLMKILSGVYAPDAGEIFLNGEPVALSRPRQAQDLGISIIYQEFNLMPNLTVAENVFVGREPNAGGFVRAAEMERRTGELLDQLGVSLRSDAVVRDLSVAEQQMVEIAKALSYDARIVIMDEPTSALTDTEVAALAGIVRGLTAGGLGVIFISHRLEEVFAMCDRVTVLRDGQNAGDVATAAATPGGIVRMMVGRNLSDLFQKDSTETAADAPFVLEVRCLSRAGSRYDASAIVLRDVSFGVRAGEIVGLAGLVGSGRTEVVRAIFGADPFDAGQVLIEGRPVDIRSPRDAIRRGLGLVPEDRKAQGLVLGLAVRDNISLASLAQFVRAGFVRLGEEKRRAEGFVRALRIRTPGLEQKVVNLSGGNQQKVVIAKWLALRPKVLIVDEPTRGIDIGAKAEVHHLMNDLARQGVAILMISSELPEILGMSDRVLVMRQGRIAGELGRAEATQEAIMGLATGVGREEQAA